MQLILWKGTIYYDWYSLYNLKMFLAARFHSLKLVLNVIFSHPPGPGELSKKSYGSKVQNLPWYESGST